MSADFEIHQAEGAEQSSMDAWDEIAAGMIEARDSLASSMT